MATKIKIKGLRNSLLEEISKLKEGSTTPANVNAVTNASGKIISTVRLQLEYGKMTGKTPEIEFME